MSISREALFSDACLVLIVAGLVCAVVRWFHMCSPYSDNEKVYYPARRQMSLFLCDAGPVGAVCADAVRTGGNDLCLICLDYIHFPHGVGFVQDLFQMGASRQVFVEKDTQLVRIAMDGCAFARPCLLPAFFLFP